MTRMNGSSNHASRRIPPARSAYNYFFQQESQRIKERIFRETGSRPTYPELAQLVARSWQRADLDQKEHFKRLAFQDKRRYLLELSRRRVREDVEGNGLWLADYHRADSALGQHGFARVPTK